ncbi:MAG: SRPBCC family protein [Acidimicrobiia bacterium]
MEVNRDAPVWLEREIQIAASIDLVWDVLTGVNDWPRWFTEGESAAIAGPVEPGTTIRMKARGTGAITARIESAEQPHVLAWTSRTFGISVISVWRLDRYDGETRVVKGESMDGFPARLMRGT